MLHQSTLQIELNQLKNHIKKFFHFANLLNMDCKCKNCGCNKTTIEEVIQQMNDPRKPFIEEIISVTERIRHFDPNANDHLFKWHLDEEDRYINSINENDWQFQFDNKLPQPLEPNKIIYIPKGVIHRLIKGTTPLSIYIKE